MEELKPQPVSIRGEIVLTFRQLFGDRGGK